MDQQTLWAVFAFIFAFLFLATGVVILLAVAGFLPKARDKFLEPLLKAFLIEMGGAVVTFFVAGYQTTTPIVPDPPLDSVFVVDLQGHPTHFTARQGNSVVLDLPTLQPRALASVARSLHLENGLLVVGDSAVVWGYIGTPFDSIVRLAMDPTQAVQVGKHYAEITDTLTNTRRGPETACRFLAVPFFRDTPIASEGLKRDAAQSLFHLSDTCFELGLAPIVMTAMMSRSGTARHKERADILYRYGRRYPASRGPSYVLATASYLHFLGALSQDGCDESCEYVRDMLRGLTRAIPTLSNTGNAPDEIHSRLDTIAFSDLETLADDLEEGVCTTSPVDLVLKSRCSRRASSPDGRGL